MYIDIYIPYTIFMVIPTGRWRRWAADLAFQRSVSALRPGNPVRSWFIELVDAGWFNGI